MAERIDVEMAGSPDGLRTIVGFQPPLSPSNIGIAERAIKGFLNEGAAGDFLLATRIIKRTPDEGEPYSEFQLEPTRLNDPRAELVGRKLMPKLVEHVSYHLFSMNLGQVKVCDPKRAAVNAGETLFGGKMHVWYKEGLDQEIIADRYVNHAQTT